MLTRFASVIGIIAFAVIAIPFRSVASTATPTPNYPAQNCGTGTGGTATINAALPTFAGSTTVSGRNSVVGFLKTDAAGQQYFNSLLAVAQGPQAPSSSPTPIPTTIQPPSFDTSSLSHTMQFASEAPDNTFTCTNLQPYQTYHFIATIYVNTSIPTSVRCPKQIYTTLQTAFYYDAFLKTSANGVTRKYTSVKNWTFDGTNPPMPQVGTTPTPTPYPTQPC